MCGIVGTNFISKQFDKSVDMLKHRGPDNNSILTYKNNQFGHTRLSIIDLDDEANQPMEFDNIVITFNGEIYNYKELIKNENLKCKTKSDTEVLIRLYQKYNEEFLNKLNGMFSFCIYDKNIDKFFCVRDRFGKKPFYYYYKHNKFIFASEIKSILNLLDKKPELNQLALSEYLSFLTPLNSSTFYNDIHKLEASKYMVLHNNTLTIKQYYTIDNIDTEYYDEESIIQDIEQLLIKSVKQRLISDVEVGTLLSGGIDSSFVSALYAKNSSKPIHTFCIGYERYEKYNEFKYANTVSKHIKSTHCNITITQKDFIDTIDKMLEHTDEPFGDTASIPTYLLSKSIHDQGIKVVLSGEGSDENFLGYNSYIKMLEYYKSQGTDEKFNLTKEWELNNRAFKNKHIYQTYGETFTESQKGLLFKNYNQKDLLLNYNNSYEAIKWFTSIDLKIWIAEVLMTKIDKMSMANSLEVRTPFLDYQLVEYLLKVSPDIKLGDTNKYLLKKIAIKYLPEDIINRPKQGFGLPFIEWLYDEFNDEIYNTINRTNSQLNIFNMQFVKFLYNEAKDKRFKQHVWNLFIFSKWFEKTYM